MNAVDTNVLLYFVDHDEPSKQAKAIALLQSLTQHIPTPTILLWQVVVELGAGLQRWEDKGKLNSQDRDAYARGILAMFPIVPPKKNPILDAFNLRDRHSLSFWDALLLTACIEAGVDTLYSEDLSHGATYDSVRVLNPFA